MNVDQLIVTCQEEHQAYHRTRELSAPVSIQMFRLAFAGDLQAWACLYKIFKSQIQRWIGMQSRIDPEEVMQEVWLSFARYAPRSETLIATDNLGTILAYLRRCVKTTLVDQARLLKRRPSSVVSIDDISETVAPDDLAGRIALSTLLQERIDELIPNERERLLFSLRFGCNIPPREIMAQYSDRFKSCREIITISHRLKSRLRQDPILLELHQSC